jgi:hypothetical protein
MFVLRTISKHGSGSAGVLILLEVNVPVMLHMMLARTLEMNVPS